MGFFFGMHQLCGGCLSLPCRCPTTAWPYGSGTGGNPTLTAVPEVAMPDAQQIIARLDRIIALLELVAPR